MSRLQPLPEVLVGAGLDVQHSFKSIVRNYMSSTTQVDAYLRLLLLTIIVFSIQVIIFFRHACGDSMRSDVQEGKTRIFVLECKK
jgi:hypothetical protein